MDLDDILQVLAAFSADDPCITHPGTDMVPCDPQKMCVTDSECPPGFECDASGKCCRTVDLDDILTVLAAFSDNFQCAHPCNPGACCLNNGTCLDWDGASPGSTPPGGMSLSACVDLSGDFAGTKTVCIGDGDFDGEDDVCP